MEQNFSIRLTGLKRLLVSCVITLALLSVFPLFSVKTQAAQTPKQAAKKIMEAIKKTDEKKLGEFVNSSTDGYYSELKTSYPDVYNYFKKNNKKLKYTIKSAKVKGDTADVKVKVKVPDSEKFVDNIIKIYGEYCDGILNGTITGTDGMTDGNAIYKKAIAASGKTNMKNVTLTLHLVRYGDKWTLSSQTSQDPKFIGITCCNFTNYGDKLLTGLLGKMRGFSKQISEQTGMSEAEVQAYFDQLLKQNNLSL